MQIFSNENILNSLLITVLLKIIIVETSKIKFFVYSHAFMDKKSVIEISGGF